MKRRLAVVIAAAGIVAAQAQVYVPARIGVGDYRLGTAPYSSTGIVETGFGTTYYRGSGAVARDPRLIYSCGHMVYDSGRWAQVFNFRRAYTGASAPTSFSAARGYRTLSGYTPNSYDDKFQYDFCIAYAASGSSFGPAIGYYENASTSLRGSGSKMILGYPASLDYNNADGGHFMHQTGPFTWPFSAELGWYYGINNVTTGGGNSGGPVLVHDGSSWRLAGVLVSGGVNSYYSGIYALGPDAKTASDLSLGVTPTLTDTTRTSSSAAGIPDGWPVYSSRAFDFTGVPSSTVRATFSLAIDAARRADIDAFVRSPSGRVRVIATSSTTGTGANLYVSNSDLSSTFASDNASGVWRLFFRDAIRSNASRFVSATLKLSSR